MPRHKTANRKRRATHELDPNNLAVDDSDSSDSMQDTFETAEQIAKRVMHRRKRPAGQKKAKGQSPEAKTGAAQPTVPKEKDVEANKQDAADSACGSDIPTEPDTEPENDTKATEAQPTIALFGSSFKFDGGLGSPSSQNNAAPFSFGGVAKPTFSFWSGSGPEGGVNSFGFGSLGLGKSSPAPEKKETPVVASPKEKSGALNDLEVKPADLDEIRKTTVPFTLDIPSSGTIKFGSVKWGSSSTTNEGQGFGSLFVAGAPAAEARVQEEKCEDNEPTLRIDEKEEEDALLICRCKLYVKVAESEVEGDNGLLERGIGRLVVKRIGPNELHLVSSREGIGTLLINARVRPDPSLSVRNGKVLTAILCNFASLLLGTKDKEEVHDDGKPRVHMLCFNLESEATELHKLLTEVSSVEPNSTK